MAGTVYPQAIDTSAELPDAVDSVTPVRAIELNRIKQAVIAIETELGVKPSRTYGTVRNRLDTIEAVLASSGGGGSILPIGASIGQTIIWDGNDWAPSTDFSPENIKTSGVFILDGHVSTPSVSNAGSGIIYFDTALNKFRVSQNGDAYVDLLGISGSLGGDLSGTISAAVVTGLQTYDIDTTAPLDGEILTWVDVDGYWAPKPAPVSFSAGGDLSGTNISQTVIAINGTSVDSNPSANQVLVATSSADSIWSQIVDGYVSASAAIAGTKISPDFGSQNIISTGNLEVSAATLSEKITFEDIAAPAVSGTGEGVIYFDSTANKFRVSENGGAYIDLVAASSLPIIQYIIPLVAGNKSADSTTATSVGSTPGAFSLDDYPATFGLLTRTITFKATIYTSVDLVQTEIQLYAFDDAAAVSSSVLTNSAASNKSLPYSVEATITVGTISGTLRSDIDQIYQVLLRRTSGSPGDESVVSNASLYITYA